MRRLDNEPVTFKQSMQGLSHEDEVCLLRAEVEQQRKEIQHLRGQLLQKSPESPMRNGVPAASRYPRASVVGCSHPVSSEVESELDGHSDFVDGEINASAAQETVLVQTQHIEQDSVASPATACSESLAATALRLASTPKGSYRTALIDTRVGGRSRSCKSPTSCKILTQAGNGHDVAVSSTPGSDISSSRFQTPASDVVSGSRARRSQSTGSVKSRSPSREPRQGMARQCIMIPENLLQPPAKPCSAQPCSAKPRLPSRERRGSQPHTCKPHPTGQQTQPKQPRPCKLESCPRPRPATFVAGKASRGKAEGALMQLQPPQAPCPQPPQHQSENGIGVAKPAQLAAMYATAGMWSAAPDCSMALINNPSTATLGACHLLHVHCATPPHAGQVADVTRHISNGESIRRLSYPNVDGTGSATHLSHSWLAVPPLTLQGTMGTQLAHGRDVSERPGLHCLDGRKLLDKRVEKLPLTVRRRSTSPPASKRKIIVAL